ncbi:MAG: GlsB/YeaQ/YmgE family stress response membrane protein [Saprospiraceae bacterium]|nr:GlsB/YeaQ/YmgE family stress response membrane protein [Saprospiraceae bacterium]
MSFLYFIIIGLIAGWLAGKIMRGSGFGLIGNILIGILGAILGGWLFGVLGFAVSSGFWGSLITATIGAVVAIFIARLIRGR